MTLYLFDHPGGVVLWRLREAILGAPAVPGALQKTVDELEAEGVVETTVEAVTPSVAFSGYRLTLSSWLKMTRGMQDVGRAVDEP